MSDLRLIEWMLADPLSTNFEIFGLNSLCQEEKALRDGKRKSYNTPSRTVNPTERKKVQKEDKSCRQSQHSLTL